MMANVEERVRSRLVGVGLEMPKPPSPAATYLPFVEHGDLLFVSGQIPLVSGRMANTGSVPFQVSPNEAHQAARIAALNSLAQFQLLDGGLDRLKRVIALTIYVASTPSFTEHHLVANAASDLMIELLGAEAGSHSRTTVGCSALPLGAPVEVHGIYALIPVERGPRSDWGP